jgi:multidrug efflux pump subunit AcrB
VFFPVVLLVGPARYLFIPLAVTVVLAMIASYFLSFTVLPAFARALLKEHEGAEVGGNRFIVFFESRFVALRDAYGRALARALDHRGFVLACAGIVVVLTGALTFTNGTDFFPTADVGIIKLHVRAPVGTRIEQTEKLVLAVESRIRQIIPPGEVRTINDMIGVPIYYNLAFVPTDNVSGMDAEVLISLNSPHRPSAEYMRRMRAELPAAFPGTSFYFQTADIVSQVLNFGLSAPIDVQIQDRNFAHSYVLAQEMLRALQTVPGIVDAHIVQVLNYPGFKIDVDRLRAAQIGVTQGQVSNNLLIALSSSTQISPSFFLSPLNGVNYTVAVQTPIEKMTSVGDLLNVPVTPQTSGSGDPASVSTTSSTAPPAPAVLPGEPVSRLSDIASIEPIASLESINHYTVQRVIDVAANIDGRDLGGVASDIGRAIDNLKKGLPSTTLIDLRGQNQVMNSSFSSLAGGLVLAILLVYALLVVLFQSWIDPLIIMTAIPGALVGILWMLALTGTSINVESLMGAIMSVGISVSNSILVVSFANDIRARGDISALDGVIEAGRTRLRPILMTALAMIIGMIPMALGLGEAGEQNAPLGRAVIGGLAVATLVTLFVVPIVYTLLRRNPPSLYMLDRRFAEELGEANPEAQHG